jgi:hypothetical protein
MVYTLSPCSVPTDQSRVLFAVSDLFVLMSIFQSYVRALFIFIYNICVPSVSILTERSRHMLLQCAVSIFNDRTDFHETWYGSCTIEDLPYHIRF